MDSNNVEILSHDTLFQAYFRVDRFSVRHGLFAGGMSGEIQREVFQRGHAVGVLLYDPDRDSVVLIEQFRMGALAAGHKPWITEIVAGIIDPNESPSDVAHRETMEEAGCTVSDLIPVYDYLVSPGCSSETVKLFCGRVDSSGVGGIFGLEHEGEDIRVSVAPLDDALARVASGDINSSIAIIGLQWLALNRTKLQARWRRAEPASP